MPDPVALPPSGRAGWRSAALVVAAVLVGLVAVTHLPGPPTASLAPSAVATLTPTPVPSASLEPVLIDDRGQRLPLTVSVPLPVGPLIQRRADGQRYVDGLPTIVGGLPVKRVRDALLVPVGTTLLIGGWYYGPDCQVFRAGPCPPATLSDDPSGSPRTDSLALDENQGAATGARVFDVTVEPDPSCYFIRATLCLPRLHVVAAMWSDDAQTATAPIAPTSILGLLSIGFPYLDFAALPGAASSRLFPSQTYVGTRASAGHGLEVPPPVAMAFIFPSTSARREAAAAVRQAQAPSGSRPGSMGTRWVVRANVMLLVSLDPQTLAIVNAAVAAAVTLNGS